MKFAFVVIALVLFTAASSSAYARGPVVARERFRGRVWTFADGSVVTSNKSMGRCRGQGQPGMWRHDGR